MIKSNLRYGLIVMLVGLISFSCLSGAELKDKLPRVGENENQSESNSSEEAASGNEEYIFDEGGFKVYSHPRLGDYVRHWDDPDGIPGRGYRIWPDVSNHGRCKR